MDNILLSSYSIPLMDRESSVEYLNHYKEFIVQSHQLRKLVVDDNYSDTVLELRPSLYINFLDRMLYSIYPDSIPFEEYVPEGWIGLCRDFSDLINDDNKYWVVDGLNLILEKFAKEQQVFKEGNK